MPRTRCKKSDNRTPLEKVQQIESKIDLLIFFGYYDGMATEGAFGFNLSDGPPGSAKHRTGIFAIALTPAQFRSKGKKLAQLAAAFAKHENEAPPHHLRPVVTPEEVRALREKNIDRRSPQEKLSEVTDVLELFVFFKYYDGYVTNGSIGFNPNSGPPGSINHKRSFANTLRPWNESQFRDKGKKLAAIAKECVEIGFSPPEILRPQHTDQYVPLSMVHQASLGGY